VRTTDREELFRSICRIATEFGHFQLTWIGLVDDATKLIVPVAMAGTELSYLDGAEISVDAASPYSTGPTGQAILTGSRVIANDLQQTMLGKPWQDRWTRFDMRASASFPLFFQGRAIGALTMYSKYAGFFTPDLTNLLDEMATDISYAMDRIEADLERLRLDAELVASNATIQGIIEGTQDVVVAVDNDLRLTLCNRAHHQLFKGLLREDLTVGAEIGEWITHPSPQIRMLGASLQRALDGQRLIEKWNTAENGNAVFYESFFAPLLDPSGRRIGAFHVGRDVSQHKKMEFELRKLTTAVEQSPVTVVITDRNGTMEYVNPSFTTASGYSAEEAIGRNSKLLQGGETTLEEYQAMWACISGGHPWSGRFHNRRKDGSLFWEEAVIAPVRDAAGTITQYIAIKQDITARLEAEERAAFLSLHDQLTNLPNRVLGETCMEAAMEGADQSGCRSALLFVDVDNFKRINDSLGYRVGDHLLRAIAARIQGCLCSTDTLSRSGGDEFLVVLSVVENSAEIDRVASAILERTRAPFAIEGFELSVTLSIGVAVYPDDSREFELLHKRADMAMYFAKKSGRNTYRFYTEKMEADANEYLLILNGLRKALERREFVLHYQPQYSLESGKVTGAEALIRWNHPELGLIQPKRFISVAEDSGLIVDIGQWVLEEACRQAVRWQQEGLGRLVVAVNLSAIQFKREGLAEVVRLAMEDAHLEPACLQRELTESILIENETKVLATVQQLKSLGVGLSLDDFGTGYASFAYLRNFELDELKIDQSFIREITTNPGDERIVKSIVELAQGFGLTTIAEGVEDLASLDIVRSAGCNRVQGYYFARPMPSDRFSVFVNSCVPARPNPVAEVASLD
jgi:diguanylate cyclase (GGDEF)-like protein/PAS domain S-box-containing protein